MSIRKKIKGAVKKASDKVKYRKQEKTFGAAFKKACSGGASSFSWHGKSYSCAKKKSSPKPGDKKFIGPVKGKSKKKSYIVKRTNRKLDWRNI
tara:strand:- start:4809 stop:5087 length:279 start_codon:yes stop_codon:yes gene_type:complete